MNLSNFTITISKNVSQKTIEQLAHHKIGGVRIPTSQFTSEEVVEVLKMFSRYKINIQLDLQGNEKGRIQSSKNMIDSGTKYGKYISLVKGDIFCFSREYDPGINNCVVGSIFLDNLEVGDVIYISDDEIQAKIISKTTNKIKCKVEAIRNVNGIYPNLGYTCPTKPLIKNSSLKILSEKDKEIFELLLENELVNLITQVAFSFVDSVEDIKYSQEIISKYFKETTPYIILKIESLKAISDISEITNYLQSIKSKRIIIEIARGDLGVMAKAIDKDLNVIQDFIVKELRRNNLDWIIATHVFDSILPQIKSKVENLTPSQIDLDKLKSDQLQGALHFMLAAEGRALVDTPHYLEQFIKQIKTSS